MGWSPAPQPDWVRAVNRGDIAPIARAAARRLDPDTVIGGVAVDRGVDTRTVADALGDATEPFERILAALEDEAQLTIFGRWFTHRFVRRLLRGRMALLDLAERDPGLTDEEIPAPLIVAGAPRTGTTYLHTLLALSDDLRAPEGWELLHPVPPPTTALFDALASGDGTAEAAADDPRIAEAGLELTLPTMVSDTLSSIHTYRARMYKECLSAMSFSFRTEEFISRYHVPSYVSWLQQADMAPAYAMHRLTLQTLQRRCPTGRWALKSPVHLNTLGQMLATYPDARVLITHRDPVNVVASVTSLIANLRAAQSDHVDIGAIGQYHLDLYSRSLDRLAAMTESGSAAGPGDGSGSAAMRGDLPGGQIVHCAYDDLVAEPVATVERALDQLGVPFTDDHRARVAERGAAATDDRVGPGRHSYNIDDLGLDPGAVDAAFARYRRVFADVLGDAA